MGRSTESILSGVLRRMRSAMTSALGPPLEFLRGHASKSMSRRLEGVTAPESAPAAAAPPLPESSPSEFSSHVITDITMAPPADPSPRILIVEDNDINRRVLAGMLALHGLQADSAEDGVEALAAMSRGRYDLVLMDSHMPRMDGYECARKLRADPGNARLIIIGVTADAMAGSREKCLAAGMDDMITKPVMDGELQRLLSRWFPGATERAPRRAVSRVSEGPAMAPAPLRDSADKPSQLWVDGRQLDEMNAWIHQFNPGFWEKGLRQFEESYLRLTAAIRAACEENRFVDAGESAHALKGVCGMMGLRRMAEICQRLELSGEEMPGQWTTLLAELEAARGPSREELRLWITP